MADKDVDKDVTDISEDEVITSDKAYSHQRRRGILMLFVYFLVALAFAVLVVLLGRWIYHRVHKDETNKPQTTSNTTPPPVSSTSNTPASGTSNSSNSSSSTHTTTPPTSTQVPNTGPGDVVGLFIGTALLVGGLHFIYGLRRA